MYCHGPWTPSTSTVHFSNQGGSKLDWNLRNLDLHMKETSLFRTCMFQSLLASKLRQPIISTKSSGPAFLIMKLFTIQHYS